MSAIIGPARYLFLKSASEEDAPNWPPAVKSLEGANNAICAAVRLTAEEHGWRADAIADNAGDIGESDPGSFVLTRQTALGLEQDGKTEGAYSLLGVRAITADGKGPDYVTHLVIYPALGRTRAPLLANIAALVVAGYAEGREGTRVALALRMSDEALANAPIYLPDEQVQVAAERALDQAVQTPRERHDLLVEVEGGRVSLHGRAALTSTGDAARAELERTPGVVEVADYILYDEELQNQVAEALEKQGLGQVNVLIEHNLAVLSGEVPDRKTYWTARDTALKIPGVRGVVSHELYVVATPLKRTADLIPPDEEATSKADLAPSPSH
jgi:osmotically-inducible protein OsmY